MCLYESTDGSVAWACVWWIPGAESGRVAVTYQ